MKEKLIKLLENSYSPYSKFRVASIVVMKDGTEFVGVNVENSSFGAEICAERNAITTAISHGYKKGDFGKLYVMCASESISMCCMICRQVLLEFFDKDVEVVAMNLQGEQEVHTVEELCPYPFSEDDLK